ncbi:MAG TPA: orotidine-5'-phosphate decarboxylase [Gemmatimonadaceae bacterium]|jgi:orotidine-5'-phosphate decarboxylase
MADLATKTTPIVPLDVPTGVDALELVEYLGDTCRFYKVGNELFTAAGPAIVNELRHRGKDVFLDLKFHDIPNTVAGGVRNAVALGARLVTVHATGGLPMLKAAVEAAAGTKCGILAVTVLTSMSGEDVQGAWGRREELDLSAEVMRLADLALQAGAHGIVCSGREAAMVREQFGDQLAILVPGVRAAGGATQDQVRVVTPQQAMAAGARYIIAGRMITAAEDRRAAMRRLLAELE